MIKEKLKEYITSREGINENIKMYIIIIITINKMCQATELWSLSPK